YARSASQPPVLLCVLCGQMLFTRGSVCLDLLLPPVVATGVTALFPCPSLIAFFVRPVERLLPVAGGASGLDTLSGGEGGATARKLRPFVVEQFFDRQNLDAR